MATEDDNGETPRTDAAARALAERRRALGEKLTTLERAEEAVVRQEKASGAGYAVAIRLGSEFVSAIVVGGLIGYGLDWLLGTPPWLMVVFLLLGFVAGVLNVLRSAGLITAPQPGNRPRRQGD